MDVDITLSEQARAELQEEQEREQFFAAEKESAEATQTVPVVVSGEPQVTGEPQETPAPAPLSQPGAAQPEHAPAPVEAKCLFSRSLPRTACSVEWGPGDHHDLFVCGEYELDQQQSQAQGKQVRLGRITVQQLKWTSKDCSSCAVSERQALSLPGVLDLKWTPKPTQNKQFLAAACADGKVHLFSGVADTRLANEQLRPAMPDPNAADKSEMKHPTAAHWLGELANKNEATSEDPGLCLSVGWGEDGPTQQLAASYSKGSLSLFSLTPTGLTKQAQWTAHPMMETWIAAFDLHTPHLIYSGADDYVFKGWDPRDLRRPTFENDSAHTAGVTTVSSNPHQPFSVATGSYDEAIRLWDTRSLRQPVESIQTGGGVWRIKWHPSPKFPSVLLAACMHNGFQMFEVSACLEGRQPAVRLSHYHHTSLAYGADWCSSPAAPHVAATCSFYDRQMHVWQSTDERLMPVLEDTEPERA